MDENKHLNIYVHNRLVGPDLLRRAGARGIPVTKGKVGVGNATKGKSIPTSDNTWIWRNGPLLTYRNRQTMELFYFERQADGHYHKVDDDSAMTAPTAGGTLAGTTAPLAPTKVDTTRTHSATSTMTTATKKKKRSTIVSAKKKKRSTTTSAKKGKVTAKSVLSKGEDSGSYSPSDGSDSEVEVITAPLPARARSGRASNRAALKNGTYVESDPEIDNESEGDFD
jgi:hypothetical protein